MLFLKYYDFFLSVSKIVVHLQCLSLLIHQIAQDELL